MKSLRVLGIVAMVLFAVPTMAEGVFWSIDGDGSEVTLATSAITHEVMKVEAVAVTPGLFWSIDGDGPPLVPEKVEEPILAQVAKGTFTASNLGEGSIRVKSEVLGLAGPVERDMNFQIDEKTLLKVCWNGNCATSRTGQAIKGLEGLEGFEGLSITGRDVRLYHDLQRPGVVSLVEIDLPMIGYFYEPSNYVSPF